MGTTYMGAQNDAFIRKQFIATSIPNVMSASCFVQMMWRIAVN